MYFLKCMMPTRFVPLIFNISVKSNVVAKLLREQSSEIKVLCTHYTHCSTCHPTQSLPNSKCQANNKTNTKIAFFCLVYDKALNAAH